MLFYGVDSNVNTIISSARRFPMMAEHQLVIVKEAQELDRFDDLNIYAKKPMPSTILVINYKHGTVDKRKSVVKSIEKVGVVFRSKSCTKIKCRLLLGRIIGSEELALMKNRLKCLPIL